MIDVRDTEAGLKSNFIGSRSNQHFVKIVRRRSKKKLGWRHPHGGATASLFEASKETGT